MPPNPSVNPEFRQHLSAEQDAAVNAAITAGRTPEDTRRMALGNILGTYTEPGEALEALQNGSASLLGEWNTLDSYRTRPAALALSPAQQARLEQIERQLVGNTQLETALPGAYQRVYEARAAGYPTMDVTELAREVNGLTARERQAEARRDAARNAAAAGVDYHTDQDYMNANAAVRAARARRQEAEGILNARRAPTQEQVSQAAAQRETQRLAEETRLSNQRTTLEGMDIRGLRNERSRLDQLVTDLTARRTARAAAGAGAEELAEIDRDLARAQERNTEAERTLGNKLAGATEDIDAGTAKTAEERFVERATSAQLINEIQVREQTAGDIRREIEGWRDELNQPATTAARRLELQNLIYDATQRLKGQEEILKLYQEAISKSNKEFRGMTPELKAQELAKLANEVDMTLYNIGDINTMLVRGQNPTKEQLAAWTKSTIQNIVEHRRGGVNLAQLNGILANRAELRLAIAAGLGNSREARNLLNNEPLLFNNWRRMWDLAGRYPGWLMILMAILAGATAAAGVVVAPLAAAAVPGAAASGVVAYGRRG